MSLSNGLMNVWRQVIDAALTLEPEGKGCSVCLVSAGGLTRQDLAYVDELFLGTYIPKGQVPDPEINKWKYFARAMISNTALHEDLVSSWQIRDPNLHNAGGAIIFYCIDAWLGLGTAGLSEEVNEAVTFVIAVKMRRLCDRDTILKIRNASQNPKLLPLMEAVLAKEDDQVLRQIFLALKLGPS